MKNILWIGLLVLFGVVVLEAIPKAAQAQTMLYIDFETTGGSLTFPNKNFNSCSRAFILKGNPSPQQKYITFLRHQLA